MIGWAIHGCRCVTADTALLIKCPSVLGATCCEHEDNPEEEEEEEVEVDKCCSEKAPVCACGSRCVTPEQAATLRCV